MLVATIALLLPAVQDAAPAPAPWVELPAGPLRDAVLTLAPDLEPAAPPAGLGAQGRAPGLAPGALLEAATWDRWRAALLELRAGDGKDARAEARSRAVLALVALEQGRHRDAHRHLAAVAAEPALLAALFPRFVPGVPTGTPLARGGRTAELANGVVLSPALPPEASESGARRAFTVRDLAIGGGKVELTLAVEHEGMQAEVKLGAGAATRLGIVLPRVEDYGVGAEYVDWEKQPTVGAPLVVEVKPEEEPHVLFARFETKDPKWPTRLPEELPASVAAEGVWLVLGAKDAERERWSTVAGALSLDAVGIECRLAPGTGLRPGGVAVDLADPATRMEKLAWLVSALERFVLRTPRR